MNGFTRYYDVGYRLIRRYWGKGYATESGKAAIDYAFNTLKLPELYATAHLENKASHNILLKIGLHYVEDFYFEQEKIDLRWYKTENHKLNKKIIFMEKQCLECGDKIVGRIDKKFCNDGCRNAYNNRVNKDSKNLIRNTNNRLRKNYRILEALNPEQKTKTSRAKLIEAGFDFNYFTSIYTTKAGKVYYFVYDQGYLPLESNYYALVKRES